MITLNNLKVQEMSVKIRLSRHGRKNAPFYHIVVADSRAPRDGRFIERLGVYDPTLQPARIELDMDKSIQWLNNGAQPTNTVRRILSYKGVLLRRHLLKGVAKGAFDNDEMERRFSKWMEEKQTKVDAAAKEVVDKKEQEGAKRHEAEVKVNEARRAAIEEKRKAQQAEEEAKRQAEAEAAKAAAADAAAATEGEAPKDAE